MRVAKFILRVVITGEYNVPCCLPFFGTDAHPPHAASQTNLFPVFPVQTGLETIALWPVPPSTEARLCSTRGGVAQVHCAERQTEMRPQRVTFPQTTRKLTLLGLYVTNCTTRFIFRTWRFA